MEWTNNHDLALAREVLLLEPYRHKVRTIERGNPLILWLNLFVATRFGHRLHNANLKVCFSRADVAVTTHALSDVTAFFKAAASRILRSLIWRLDNAAVGRGGPGEEPEVTESTREPEVVQKKKKPGNNRLFEKPLITPAPFDGNTSWDDYQVQFELISELNGWNKKVMAIYLAARLSGCAQAVLADLDERSRNDYFTLKEALALRFGNGGKTELYRAQLRNRVKGRDETLPELAQAIQRLVRQAHPEERHPLQSEKS